MWRRLIYHPDINYALRQTLVLCLPVVAGLLLNNLTVGLLFSLVPACCNIAGLDTPHRHFFKRLWIGGILFASSSLLLQLLVHWQIPLPLIMLGMALLLGVSDEISPLYGRLLAATLVAVIFSLSMVGTAPIWQPPLLFIAGTIWYGLFTWGWFRLWKAQPMRESLSLLYRQFADYFEAKYHMLTQSIDPTLTLPALLERQQKILDLISQLEQQLYVLALNKGDYQQIKCDFQIALDLQEHLSVSLHHPEKMQQLIKASHAEMAIWNSVKVISQRLRLIADAILYHRPLRPFSMEHKLADLLHVANQSPDNPVGHFCHYNFSRIAHLLHTQRPLYLRDLTNSQPRLSAWSALSSYLSWRSASLRSAARLGVTLAVGSSLGQFLHLPKAYWILLAIMMVTQSSYSATRVRIQHRALGTLIGLVIAAGLLHLQMPKSVTLSLMLCITLCAYLVVSRNYGLSVVGLTITGVYTMQLLSGNSLDFLFPRLLDTLLGCLLAFAGTLWLWPQWQSSQLRNNAQQSLERDQDVLRLLLQPHPPDPVALADARMQANQAHNTLLTSLNQAIQEPCFNAHYLADMRLWITHSQLVVEHLNALTMLTREHSLLPPLQTTHYLQLCEIALQSCQQRLEHDHTDSDDDWLPPAMHQQNEAEHHLQRILAHLSVMHTISSLVWKLRPHHRFWHSQTQAWPHAQEAAISPPATTAGLIVSPDYQDENNPKTV